MILPIVLQILFVLDVMAGALVKKSVPGPFSSKKRNYEAIVLGGSAMYYRMKKPGQQDAWNLSFFRRGIYASYLLLNRFFSFGKAGATVVLGIDPAVDFTSKRSRRFTPADLACLHKVTLAEIGVPHVKSKQNHPLLWAPLFTLELLVDKFLKIKLPYKKKNIRISQECYRDFAEIFEKLVSFCKQRNLRLKVVVMGQRGNLPMLDKLKEEFSDEGIEWQWDEGKEIWNG
jgi:hypothetical protein